MSDYKNILYNTYDALFEAKTLPQKEQILFTIIELKNEYPQLSDVHQSKYKDFKDFCLAHISHKTTLDYNHSTYSEDIILNLLDNCKFDIEEQYHILIFIKNLYKDSHLNHTNIDQRIIKTKISIAWQRKKHLKWLLLVLSQKTSYTFWAILLFFIFELIILSPAPTERMEVLHFSKVEYSDNSIINHTVNTISLHLDFLEGATLQAINAFGVIVIGIWSIIYIILIVNILFKNLLTRIELYDPE